MIMSFVSVILSGVEGSYAVRRSRPAGVRSFDFAQDDNTIFLYNPSHTSLKYSTQRRMSGTEFSQLYSYSMVK